VAADVQLHLGASGLPVYKAAAARVLPEFARAARAQLPGGPAFAAWRAAEERVRDTPGLEPFVREHRQKLRAQAEQEAVRLLGRLKVEGAQRLTALRADVLKRLAAKIGAELTELASLAVADRLLAEQRTGRRPAAKLLDGALAGPSPPGAKGAVPEAEEGSPARGECPEVSTAV
jgi:hypothetical protein